MWTIGFVGAGVMAEVMIDGLLAQEGWTPERIIASDRHPERVAELREEHGIRTTTNNSEACQADLVVLAVKPQNLREVLEQLRGQLAAETTVVSIVAGAPLAALQPGLTHQGIVRAMPNLPCRIRQGMTVWFADPTLGAEARGRVAELLGVMGQQIQADVESHVDMATAINGTGPAIVAEFVKHMVEAASFIGEPRDLAHKTVLATLMGTARLIEESDAHVAQLIDDVASPGGTTTRALQVLKMGRFGGVLTDALDAAYQQTLALGRSISE